ncbi:MAG: diguanylate cyclase [Desulfuromonadales bacterium]|nr:MAG: diguanylate cyclase [Desulfuromonadales bacterium]
MRVHPSGAAWQAPEWSIRKIIMATDNHQRDISVLCVDDDEHNRKIIGLMLESKVTAVHYAKNGAEGIEVYGDVKPDIVITDIMMPVMSGLEMTRRIREINPKANIIVVTAFSSIDFLTEAIDVGVNQFVTKPIKSQSLHRAVERCYESVVTERMLRDQHDRISLLSRALEESPSAVAIVTCGGTIEYVNRKFSDLTGWDAQELIGEDVRAAKPLKGATDNWEQIWDAAAAGTTWEAEIQFKRKGGDNYWGRTKLASFFAGDYGCKYILMIEDITDQKRFEEELHYIANHDALTGLYNRGFFEEELRRLASGRAFPVSIILADIDGLKQVNDTLGHDAGDRLIQRAAQILLDSFRTEDIVARIGGDEFAVLLPDADEEVVSNACTRGLRCQEHLNESNDGLPVNLSFGTATAYIGGELTAALKLADERMYGDKLQRKMRIGTLSPGRQTDDGAS